ncbi:MAG: mechanosensitive ion channel [candidate division Zixibacteria bacterium]|nr:mechanosensitive ion channel [candidate division Zixibacteria bacterium]
MDLIQQIFDNLRHYLPTGIAVIAVVFVIAAVRHILNKRYAVSSGYRYRLQIIMTLLFLAGLVVVIMALPISDTSRGQLLSLLGIVLSAAIALSSTTLVGNAMAGMMLRVVRSFRPGDFIRVGDHFGRVSERGLLHVEIQTEDRDLTTLPNLYLVTNPVKVIRTSGTFITAEVSLGYDVPRTKVERLLIEAAEAAKLEDAFVLIVKLGDYSITYRAAGLLTKVKHIISTRSLLQAKMLDKLHEGGVEIVSPSFMNTRAIHQGVYFTPTSDKYHEKARTAELDEVPEAIVFDKAEQAENKEKLREKFEATGKEHEELRKKLDEATTPEERDRIQAQLDKLQARRELLAEYLKKKEG